MTSSIYHHHHNNNYNHHNHHSNDNNEGWDKGDKGMGQGFESQTHLEPQNHPSFCPISQSYMYKKKCIGAIIGNQPFYMLSK